MKRDPQPAARRTSSPPLSNRDRWLLSYADFLTLLLALFVVLYASARVDASKNRGLFDGLQATFAIGEPAAVGSDPDLDGDMRQLLEPIGSLAPLEQLESSLVKQLDREWMRMKSDPGVSVHATKRGLVISLAAAEYFPADGAEIPAERKRVLAAIAPLIAAEEGSLEFEGHTDDRPVQKGSFPSNWELSSARAAAVARYFIDEHGIDPRRVTTTGYAEFRPVTQSDAPAERARNRRVEIVVLADGEFVESQRSNNPERELGRLLEKLPPIAPEVDEALRPPAPGPAPFDIPLP